jgi:hypothetical protein
MLRLKFAIIPLLTKAAVDLSDISEQLKQINQFSGITGLSQDLSSEYVILGNLYMNLGL